MTVIVNPLALTDHAVQVNYRVITKMVEASQRKAIPVRIIDH